MLICNNKELNASTFLGRWLSKKFAKKWDESVSVEYKQVRALFNVLTNELDESFKTVNQDAKKILSEAQVVAEKKKNKSFL